MTTITEIETAVSTLPPAQVDALASWLIEYQTMIHASAEIFAKYDAEEGDSADQWIGDK